MIIYRGYGIVSDPKRVNQWRVCSISNPKMFWGISVSSISAAYSRIDNFYKGE